MIKLFRNIRKKLVSDKPSLSRTSNYLKYAIGEIVLVVIGILIAIQINNWNTERIGRHLEQKYLRGLIEDINFEWNSFEGGVLNRFQKKIDGLKLGKQYALGRITVNDTAEFIKKVGFGGAFSRGSNLTSNTTFQELISTGNLKLIQNEPLKKDILFYHLNRDFLTEYTENLRTDYATFNNSLTPYDPAGTNQLDSLDFKRILKNYKKEEFLMLVNQELTFGYSIKFRIEKLNQLAKELVNNIEVEIE